MTSVIPSGAGGNRDAPGDDGSCCLKLGERYMCSHHNQYQGYTVLSLITYHAEILIWNWYFIGGFVIYCMQQGVRCVEWLEMISMKQIPNAIAEDENNMWVAQIEKLFTIYLMGYYLMIQNCHLGFGTHQIHCQLKTYMSFLIVVRSSSSNGKMMAGNINWLNMFWTIGGSIVEYSKGSSDSQQNEGLRYYLVLSETMLWHPLIDLWNWVEK